MPDYNGVVVVLRYTYVIALSVWLGGMLSLGTIVAPAIFAALEIHDAVSGQALAGDVFGETLRRFRFLEYVAASLLLGCLTAMAKMGARPVAYHARLAIIVAMFGISLFSGVWVTGQIETLQVEAGNSAGELAGHLRSTRFDILHGLSTTLMFLNIGGALALVYLESRN